MRINELEARESGLEYFLGRPVTVLMRNAARYPQSDEEFHKTYTGTLAALTTLGVWLQSLHTEDKSFFFWSQVGGIIKEEETTEDDPRIQKALARKPGAPSPPLQQLGIDRVKGLTGKAKEEYERL